MKILLKNEISVLKIVGRRNDGRIVLEIIVDPCVSLVGELVSHLQSKIEGWILAGAYHMILDYTDHMFYVTDNEVPAILEKL